MSRFPATAIDFSLLPAPSIIETLSFEAILAEQKTDCLARLAAAGIVLDTLTLESEPVTVILETVAYREVLLRGRVNDAAKAVLLAYSYGTNLDHLGALFGVLRMALVASPRPFAAHAEDWEADDRFRRRIQLAPDAYSNAGTLRGYMYHALSASPDVADVHAFSPLAGRVDVVVLGAVDAAPGPGKLSNAAMSALYARLNDEDVKPLTDDVRLSQAAIVGYTVDAMLRVRRGPDPGIVKAQAVAAQAAYSAGHFLVDEVHYASAIAAALQVPNVYEVVLNEPSGRIVPGDYAAARCTGATILTEIADG